METEEVEKLPDNVRRYIRKLEGEVIVEVLPQGMQKLREWMKFPNGACSLGSRITFEAVGHGGILVRSKQWHPSNSNESK